MPELKALDHLVLTVTDMGKTINFYRNGLGMKAIQFEVADGSKRWALSFGNQKINLHPADGPFDPKARCPQPGSADLCFLSDTPLHEWITQLADRGIDIEDGPVPRSGATGPILSIYLRDPDGNLIEVSNLRP